MKIGQNVWQCPLCIQSLTCMKYFKYMYIVSIIPLCTARQVPPGGITVPTSKTIKLGTTRWNNSSTSCIASSQFPYLPLN